uniref:Uncharacterized protein n=1 Tax=Romanomermis culicivorax TaxID=13658 RepID=A0A915KFA7_ROMCU
MLTEHTGRVFRLQFDDFQLVSSSHDDSILIWDFLNFGRPEQEEGGGVVATEPGVKRCRKVVFPQTLF